MLVHGLGRTPASLFPLAAAVRKAGHRTHFFGYSSTLEGWDRIVGRLVKRLAMFHSPVGLVGHSLGGLLLRAAVPQVPGLKVRHLVMLGTPNRPPRLAAYFWKWRPFRLFSRSCGELLVDMALHAKLPIPACPTTVIAGTGGPRRRIGPFGGEPNDGVVNVAETMLDGHPPPLELPVLHTWMMNDRRAIDVVVQKFSRDATRSDQRSSSLRVASRLNDRLSE